MHFVPGDDSFHRRLQDDAEILRNRGKPCGAVFAWGVRMPHIDPSSPTAPAQPMLDGKPADPAGDWPTLDVLRLRYIHRAIEHTNNNKTRAAELLGIDRRTLNRILARERARRRTGGEATH
jgi:DNA-binding NtrC family response regulator